ncbi:hypothetical protein ACP70R_036331 [Stipagrostis hirtigluma subsp. patula]
MLHLTSHSLVLLPVNDMQHMMDRVAGAGNHRSLLIIYTTRPDFPYFVHHDSPGKANLEATNRLVNTLREEMQVAHWPLYNVPTPLQGNTCDFGIYMMAIAEVVYEWLTTNQNIDFAHIPDWVDMVNDACANSNQVSSMRQKFLALIQTYIHGKVV